MGASLGCGGVHDQVQGLVTNCGRGDQDYQHANRESSISHSQASGTQPYSPQGAQYVVSNPYGMQPQQYNSPHLYNQGSAGGPMSGQMMYQQPQMTQQYSNPYMQQVPQSPVGGGGQQHQQQQQQQQYGHHQQQHSGHHQQQHSGQYSPRQHTQQQMPIMQPQNSGGYIVSSPTNKYQTSSNQIDPRLSGGNIIAPVVVAEGNYDSDDSSKSSNDSEAETATTRNDETTDAETDIDDKNDKIQNQPSRESIFQMKATMVQMMSQNSRSNTAMGAYNASRPMPGGAGYAYGGGAVGRPTGGVVGGGYVQPQQQQQQQQYQQQIGSPIGQQPQQPQQYQQQMGSPVGQQAQQFAQQGQQQQFPQTQQVLQQ